ncbi:MAG: AbrB/MazE/SpoVT family DNA-binding domain-containing protein [Rhizomicrobium sp.]
MRITSKGQVTIPARVREEGGFMPNTEVDFVRNTKGNFEIVPAKDRGKAKSRGEKLIEQMKKGPRITGMTTEQIMKLTRG